MAERKFIVLERRSVLVVAGADAGAFLQNLISNDVDRVEVRRAIYATLLTPQGKFLHDFVVSTHPQAADGYLIETEAGRVDDLEKRLTMYRLRADVTMTRADPVWAVFAGFGDGTAQALGLESDAGSAAATAGGVICVDPRLVALGIRAVGPAPDMRQRLEAAGFSETDQSAYEHLRLSLGVPDGSRDILVEKSYPLECNLDDLNAIDYEKGCYVGQELTARTHHRAKIRKRLFPVKSQGPVPEAGTPITFNGKEVGEMRSGDGQQGLALLRIESLRSAEAGGPPLMVDGMEIVPDIPAWLKIDDAPDSDSA